jgi:hypothetical protein
MQPAASQLMPLGWSSISAHLKEPEVQYRVHNSTPVFAVQSLINPILANPSHLFKTHINTIF